MKPYYEDGSVTLHHGDCLDILRELPDASVDAVVTDPPYGLEFMGKDWDAFGKDAWRNSAGMTATGYTDGGKRIARPSYGGGDSANPTCATCGGRKRGAKKCACASPEWRVKGKPLDRRNNNAAQMRAFGDWCELWTAECLRVLKPGGHLLAFGGTRTWHRLAVAVEDAGFEVRDSIAWLYGSGFPKSLRVSRDERYCHCDASAHTSSGTSPAPQHDDHTRTEASEALAAGGAQSAPRATSAPLDSPDDCRPALGSGDALPHPAGVNDPTSAQPQGCAQARSRSGEREGGPDAGSSRTPSPARRNGHPSSRSSAPLADSQTSGSTHKLASTSPAGTSESAHHTPGTSLDPSYLYGTGFPVCGRCHKPNADGLGTALKPAFEPIVVGRKPLAGTVAANVLEHGTGALNIDGCRVNPGEAVAGGGGWAAHKVESTDGWNRPYTNGVGKTEAHTSGRWPTNVVLDGSQAAALDEQSGERTSGKMMPTHTDAKRDVYGQNAAGGYTTMETYGDTGGVSRFFPTFQSDPCDVCGEDMSGWHRDGRDEHVLAHVGESLPTFRYEAKAPASERPKVNGTAHPTVKPLDLMRWLVRLVTPPGGTVLEPFAGSGTTVEACVVEGFKCVAIEKTGEYLPLTVARIHRRRDPVAYMRAAGDDLGLFDL